MDLDEINVTTKQIKKTIFTIGGILIAIFLLLNSFAIVGPGERGIKTTFGAVDQFSLVEGLHFKIPIVQHIEKLNVKTQKVEASAESASKDLQDVHTIVAVNFHIDPSKAPEIYQTIGVTYSDTVIAPAIQESVKAATARFNAESLITQRPLIKEEIETHLKERLLKYGIIQESVSITNFKFSDQFTQSIESKVSAEQNALKAENDLKRIEIEAKQKIAEASGRAESKIIEAKAEAEALKLQKEVIDETLLALRAIEKWNGVLPQVTSEAIPFIEIKGGN